MAVVQRYTVALRPLHVEKQIKAICMRRWCILREWQLGGIASQIQVL